MTNAIIDTLKAKNENGEEYLLYPRSKTSAISDSDGKTLDVILSELNNNSSSSTDITVPTKISELENDIGYITHKDLPEGMVIFPDVDEIYKVVGDYNITKEQYPYMLVMFSNTGRSYLIIRFAQDVVSINEGLGFELHNYYTFLKSDVVIPENATLLEIINIIAESIDGAVYDTGDTQSFTEFDPFTYYYTNFDLNTLSVITPLKWQMLINYGSAGQYIITNGDGTIGFANGGGSDTNVIVPTKVSELENDIGYITSNSIPSKVSDLENDAEYITSNSIPTKVSDLDNDAGYIKASDLPNIDTDITVPTKVSELENDIGYITTDDLTTLDGESVYSTERKTLEVTAYADTVIDSITLPAGTYYVQGMFQYSGTDLRYLQRLRANKTSFANVSLYDNVGVVVGCISGVCELDSESTVDYQVYLNKRDESSNPATCELKFVSMTAARISSGVTIDNSTDSHIVDYSPAIKSVNHRGYSVGAPENTLPAYILSKQKGFDYVECDVAFTSDGVAVLLHDDTIDRTSDGSGSVSSLTYEQLLTYDFGSWFSANYAGTNIPTFEEFIKLCKQIGLHPYIELKSSGDYTQEQITSIVDMVNANGMKGKVTYISFNSDFLGYVKSTDANARLGYLSSTATDSVITTVTSLRSGSNEVYVGVNYTALTDNFISNCIADSIPLEIWTVNDVDYIRNMNGYISGVTSDSLIASDILRGEYIDSVGTIGFPTNENGTANHGVAGQFLVSNGDGSVSWVSLEIAEGGAF